MDLQGSWRYVTRYVWQCCSKFSGWASHPPKVLLPQCGLCEDVVPTTQGINKTQAQVLRCHACGKARLHVCAFVPVSSLQTPHTHTHT